MTAKPESVESLCAKLATLSKGLAADILTAHRAELAEALKEPTLLETNASIDAATGRDKEAPTYHQVNRWLCIERRRKHGVD